MARYYFDVYDGDFITIDDEGLVLSSRAIALSEAARTIAEIARDRIPHYPNGHRIVINARDLTGPVLSVSVTFETTMFGSNETSVRALEPTPEEVLRLLEAFSSVDEKTKAEIVAIAEHFASRSPKFAEELLKKKTKH